MPPNNDRLVALQSLLSLDLGKDQAARHAAADLLTEVGREGDAGLLRNPSLLTTYSSGLLLAAVVRKNARRAVVFGPWPERRVQPTNAHLLGEDGLHELDYGRPVCMRDGKVWRADWHGLYLGAVFTDALSRARFRALQLDGSGILSRAYCLSWMLHTRSPASAATAG